MTGMTIPQIFETYGEEYFRDMETEFLRTFRDEYCIIATGGGVAMRQENREIMRRTGLVFFLNAPFRDIWRRISTDRNRPDRTTVNTFRAGKPIYQTQTPLLACGAF